MHKRELFTTYKKRKISYHKCRKTLLHQIFKCTGAGTKQSKLMTVMVVSNTVLDLLYRDRLHTMKEPALQTPYRQAVR